MSRKTAASRRAKSVLRKAETKAAELIAWAESPQFTADFPKVTGAEFARNVARILGAYYSEPREARSEAKWSDQLLA
jgi:hypothetical protein